MSSPRMAAEGSLYRTTEQYRTLTAPLALAESKGVLAQQWWPPCHWDPYTHQVICCHWTYWHGWVCQPVPSLRR